jgi:predicted ester cyclase
MSADVNQAVHRRWLEECWSDGEIDLQDQLVSPDVVDHNPVPGMPDGLDGQRMILRLFREAFDMHTRIDLMLADRDYVTARWTATFVHKGDFMGMPATGRSATITGIDICRYRAGKIVELWHQEDVIGLMSQLGALPEPARSSA